MKKSTKQVHSTKVYLRVARTPDQDDDMSDNDEQEEIAWKVVGRDLVSQLPARSAGLQQPKTPALKRFAADQSLEDQKWQATRAGVDEENGNFLNSWASCPYTPMVQRSAQVTALVNTPHRSRGARQSLAGATDGSTSFAFDHIFSSESAQEDVFDELQDLLDSALCNGYFATVFSFGQANTGKTFTMIGNLDRYEDAGIVPRALERAFEQGLGQRQRHEISLAMLEAGSDSGLFHTLLDGQSKEMPESVDASDVSQVREAAKPVRSFAEATGLLAAGLDRQRQFRLLQQNRSRGTGSSDRSGRTVYDDADDDEDTSSDALPVPGGHTLIFVFVDGPRFQGRLTFVDLAGARPLSLARTKADVGAIRRANCSLAALGETLAALSSSRYDGPLPYASDPLVAALADSLGGDSQTAFLITADLAPASYSETLLSCVYATRARRIRALTSAHGSAVDEQQALIDQLVQEASLNHAVLETTVRECHRLEELVLAERREAQVKWKRTDRQWRARVSDLEWTKRQHEQQIMALRIDRARVVHQAAEAEVQAQQVAAELVEAKLDLLMAAEFAAEMRQKKAGVDAVVSAVDSALAEPGAAAVDADAPPSNRQQQQRRRGRTEKDQDDDGEEKSESSVLRAKRGSTVADKRAVRKIEKLKEKVVQLKRELEETNRVSQQQAKQIERHEELVDRTAPLQRKISRADANAFAHLEQVAIALKAEVAAKDRRIERLAAALEEVKETVRQEHLMKEPALINYNADGQLEDDDNDDNTDDDIGMDHPCGGDDDEFAPDECIPGDGHDSEHDELVQSLQKAVISVEKGRRRGHGRKPVATAAARLKNRTIECVDDDSDHDNDFVGSGDEADGSMISSSAATSRRRRPAMCRKKSAVKQKSTKNRSSAASQENSSKATTKKSRRAPPSATSSPNRPVKPARKARAIAMVPSPLEQELESKMSQASISDEKPVPRSSLEPAVDSTLQQNVADDASIDGGATVGDNDNVSSTTTVAAVDESRGGPVDASSKDPSSSSSSLMDMFAAGDRPKTGGPLAVPLAKPVLQQQQFGRSMDQRADDVENAPASSANIRPPNAGRATKPMVFVPMGNAPATRDARPSLPPKGPQAQQKMTAAPPVSTPPMKSAGPIGEAPKKKWNAADFLISPPHVYPTVRAEGALDKKAKNAGKKPKMARKPGKSIKAAPTLDQLLKTGAYVLPKLK